MTNNLFFRCSTVLAALLIAFSVVMPVRAQPANTTALLDDAYATLAQARHDYKGHRVKAMKQIE
jgi:hypothetical protein